MTGPDHVHPGAKDDSAQGARGQATRPALRRGVRAPPEHMRSRKGGNGSAYRAAGSNCSDNSESTAITVCSRRSHQASLDFRQYNYTYTQANQNIATSKSRLLGSKQLPQQALHPVAVDRARKNALGNDET